MWKRRQPDALDAKWIFWAYATAMGMTGFALSGFGGAVQVNLLGAALVVIACFSAALASVEEPRSRRRGLRWFIVANLAVFIVMMMQSRALWGEGHTAIPADLFVVAFTVFIWVLGTADGQLAGRVTRPLSLFSAESTAQLRSRYEQQIREAAGREERHRLARELHDSIKQQIFVVQTAAAAAQARFDGDKEGTKQALATVRSAAREAMGEMEAMLEQLQAAPLENTGLVEALKKQCEALGFRTGAEVRFMPGELPPNESLPPGAQQAFYRIAQEALANVSRHARATRVDVALTCIGSYLLLRIEDDGAGFDANAAPRGMGLRNMRARAEEFDGSLEIISHPGGGTTVELRLPFDVAESGEWKRYRTMALISGLVVIAWIPLLFWRDRSMMPAAMITCAGIMFVRSVIGWRKLKTR